MFCPIPWRIIEDISIGAVSKFAARSIAASRWVMKRPYL
jgi:hypothetical protein